MQVYGYTNWDRLTDLAIVFAFVLIAVLWIIICRLKDELRAKDIKMRKLERKVEIAERKVEIAQSRSKANAYFEAHDSSAVFDTVTKR